MTAAPDLDVVLSRADAIEAALRSRNLARVHAVCAETFGFGGTAVLGQLSASQAGRVSAALRRHRVEQLERALDGTIGAGMARGGGTQ